MRIAMIVAATQNGVIGRDNQMPWHLPEDLKYFKRITMGKPIIMGRKTYESIGRPLPGRTNIVVTRQPEWRPKDAAGQNLVRVVSTLEAGFEIAKNESAADEVMIIGGAQIYAACTDIVQRVYLTEIAADIDGDAYFDRGMVSNWREVARENFCACEKNPYDYSFVVFDRAEE